MKTHLSHTLLFLFGLVLLNTDAKTQQLVHSPEITALGSSASIQRVKVTFQTSGTVDQVKVVTRGSEDLDFRSEGDTCRSAAYSVGQSCTVSVRFKPTAPGERQGAILLLDSGRHVLATQPMAALATGPIATFVPGIISTVAGNPGSFFFAGDNGPATSASLFLPFGVAVNGAGAFYIADTYNNRVRVVNAQTGIITTVAGNGTGGFSGDGGSALTASLDNPSSVQLDAAGNIYISDKMNNRIRVVNATTGIITTVAGVGTAAYAGDGGAATSASLNAPNGIALDGTGNLYIADTANNVIRRVDAISGVITTVAGNGVAAYRGDGGSAAAASLNSPWAVAVLSSGAFYVADQKNHSIRAINAAGTISTIAGNGNAGNSDSGGLASASRLTQPSGVVVDVAGNIYIADTGNNRVRKISAGSNLINTIAGGGGDGDNFPANLASLYGPYGLALDGQGSLFIADAAHNRIRKVASNIAILYYPLMRVGSISAPMDELLENDGTATLDLSSIAPVANAQVDPATTCSASVPLAPLAQCTIAADAAPTAVGGVNGSITIGSNGTNAPNMLFLSGNVQSTYPTTVLLSSTPNPSIVGNAVTFSVQVVNSGGTYPTGNVVLLDGTATIATIPLTNGIGSVSISTLTVGTHPITASYSGDSNDSSSVSQIDNQIVTAVPLNSSTTTSITSSSNPINVGQILNLNAKVAAVTAGQPVPTGTVTFMEGTTVLGTATLNTGTASIGISTLTAGSHLITAVYSGSSSYSGSTSPVLTQVVVAPNTGTTTSLTASADPINVGQTLILTSTVSAVTAGQSVPTGTVNYMDGTTLLGTSPVTSGGATFTTSTLSVGTHLITAMYVSDGTYATSTSPVLTEIVVAAGTGNATLFTMTVAPPQLTLVSGAHTSMRITITPSSGFTDTVSFGCAGLPIDATCTFSQTQLAVAGTTNGTLTVLVDTGNPLDSGASAHLERTSKPGAGMGKSAVLACLLPGGAFLAFLMGGNKRRRLNLLLLAIVASTLTVISGCGSSYKVQTTPAGTYQFQIFATATTSGASYTVPVQLTVTK
jgi:sugar lactone lactonase YvrE